RSSVGLRVRDVEVDAWQFQRALARVRAHDHPREGSCIECLDALDGAVALDRGEFMAGFAVRSSEFDAWQAAAAEAYRRELTGALERLARGRAATGAWAAAIRAAQRWLELDPLHEPAHVVLMSALAAAGEPAAALEQYRGCVRILDAELGVAPLAETTALAEAIRDGRSTPASVRPAAPRMAQPTAAQGVRPAPVQSAPLVGRATQLGALIAGYSAVGPDGRLLVIEGEAGIGKTRLGAELAEHVQGLGGGVLAARNYSGEQAIAFAPIVELIRAGIARPGGSSRLRVLPPAALSEAVRVVPELGEALGADGVTRDDPFGRTRLFAALAEILVALAGGAAPGLLWLDDLHRADASTIEFTGYLARRLRARPVALLVTWRPEELPSGVHDHVLAAPEGDHLAVRISLGRLDREEVGTLAAVTLGEPVEATLADSLFERSEGLPLYVAEALASPTWGEGRMPDGVAALLNARLDGVGPIARQIISAAAVIGRSFGLDIVQDASGRTEGEVVDGLDELVGRRLILEAGADEHGDVRYDFTHGRLRDVAYERLSLARRRLLHARVADALARPSPGRSGVGRWSSIAYHEGLAGRSARAAEAHYQAGEAARRVFANAEARGHLESALALGHPAVADIHAALGDVLILLGDYEGALSHLETALGLADPDHEAQLDHQVAIVLARAGERDRADRYLIAALAALGPRHHPGIRARILVDRSAIAQREGDPERAEELASEALSLGEIAQDPTAVARAEDLLGIIARGRQDLALARQHLERAIAAADVAESASAADAGVRTAALNTLALVYADAGDRVRAIELTREALVQCERQGDRHRQAALENNLADLFHAEGHDVEAMEHLKRAVALFAEVGARPGDLQPEVWKLVEW
ncbi:MAG TPA: BTAD domain-containing putative transcriptional regulator, partial [Candidatus Limnocylindrales bacterium]